VTHFSFILLTLWQILRHESRKAAILRIRWRIDNERARKQQAEKEEDSDEPAIDDADQDEDKERPAVMTLMSPGSAKPVSAERIKQNRGVYDGFMGDTAFGQFDVGICQFLQAEQAVIEEKDVAEVEMLQTHEIMVCVFLPVWEMMRCSFNCRSCHSNA